MYKEVYIKMKIVKFQGLVKKIGDLAAVDKINLNHKDKVRKFI